MCWCERQYSLVIILDVNESTSCCSAAKEAAAFVWNESFICVLQRLRVVLVGADGDPLL